MVAMAKLTYKIWYDKSVKEFHTVVALFYTAASVTLISSALIPPKWRNSMKQSLTRLRTATKQQLQIEGIVLLHLRLGDLYTWVWFSIESELIVNMVLVTAFIDILIRGIFSSKGKFVPRHSLPVATRTNSNQVIISTVLKTLKGTPRTWQKRRRKRSWYERPGKLFWIMNWTPRNGHYRRMWN